MGIEYSRAIELIESPNTGENLARIFSLAKDLDNSRKNIEMCGIISLETGGCLEDCKFCAQSAHYGSSVEDKYVEDYSNVEARARELEGKSVSRFSMVKSGGSLQGLDRLKDYTESLRKSVDIGICISSGMASYEELLELKNSGVKRYHHNLETSRNYYKNICSTHSYDQRIETIKNAKRAGLEVCSGGILGIGESRMDRIDMIYQLKELGVDSIPINILRPVSGTPLEDQKGISNSEVLKTIAVYRLVYPQAEIRYGAGREQLGRDQELGLELGVRGMIVGDYLTTVGSSVDEDKEMILEFEKNNNRNSS